MNLEELKTQIATADSPAKVSEVIAKYNAERKAEAKAEQERIAKENEELAQARGEFDAELLKVIQGAVEKHYTDKQGVNHLNEKLAELKSTGFKTSYEVESNTLTAKVVFPEPVKTRKSPTTNGTKGASRDLNAIFEANATPEDKEELAKAQELDKQATAKLGHTTNSNAWRIKDKVAKRVSQ